MVGCLTIEEFERKWKEAVMTNIRVLARDAPRGTEENYKLRVRTVVPTRFETGTSRTQFTTRANLFSVKILVS
jgi:hypothetical protein